jgi:hypothetical protein
MVHISRLNQNVPRHASTEYSFEIRKQKEEIGKIFIVLENASFNALLKTILKT